MQIFLDCLAAAGVKSIDTAQLYGENEAVLGEASSRREFDIGTKLPGITVPGSFQTEQVVERTQESPEVDQIDILYLHTPDPSIPIEQTLQGIQQLSTEGAFRRFGLSNYTAKDVKTCITFMSTRNLRAGFCPACTKEATIRSHAYTRKTFFRSCASWG